MIFPRRKIAILSAAIVAWVNVVCSGAPIGTVWSERRPGGRPTTVAALPPSAAHPSARLANLALPALQSRTAIERPRPRTASARELTQWVPTAHARIREITEGPEKDFFVLLVQDVHLNREAQANIAGVLEEWGRRPGGGRVAIEGAFGAMQLERFRRFGDRALRENVARAFLEKNLISAPFFAGLLSPGLEVAGVDDPGHYWANVDAYLASRDADPAVQKKLGELRSAMETAKRARFSPALAALDRAVSAHHAGAMGFGAYLDELARGAPVEPVIAKFLQLYSVESKLDFPRIERERRRALEQIARRASEADMGDLVGWTLAHRAGAIGVADFYGRLAALCGRLGVRLSDHPEFDAYVRYVIRADAISADELLSAAARLEDRRLRETAVAERERRLLAADARLRLIEKISNFALTPDEWERYAAALHDPGAIAAEAGLFNWRAPSLQSHEAFYRHADARSRVIVNNLIHRFGRAPVALVCGGFHTPLVAKLLRQQGASVAVVTPRLSSIEPGTETSYLSVFGREKTSLDRLFTGERLFVSPASIAAVGTPADAALATTNRALAELAARHKEATGTDADPAITTEGGPDVRVRSDIDGFDVVVDTTRPPTEGTSAPAPSVAGILQELAGRLETAPAEARASPGGLIGKFQVLTPPVFDEARGLLKFVGRNVETGETVELEIGAQRINFWQLEETVAKLFSAGHPVVTDILEKALDSSVASQTLVLEPNEFGIHGLGTADIVAVGRNLLDEPLAIFHEIAESLGARGLLTADGLLEALKNEPEALAWFRSRAEREGREGIRLHYAIRALQRVAFSVYDGDLTAKIKGRLDIIDVLARARDAGVKSSRVTRAFRQRRWEVGTRAQELSLIEEIIAEEAAREKFEAQERQAEAEQRALAFEAERRARSDISAIIRTAENALQSTGDWDEQRAIADAVLAGLAAHDPRWVADELFHILKIDTALTGRLLVGYLRAGGLANLGAPVSAALGERFLAEAAWQRPSKKERALAADKFKEVVSQPEIKLEPEQLDRLFDALIADFPGRFRETPGVPVSRVADVQNRGVYFEPDGSSPGRLLFKKDFLKLVARLRDPDLRKRLIVLYRQEHFDRESAGKLLRTLIFADGTRTHVISRALDLIEAGSLPAEAADVIMLLVSEFPGFWKDDASIKDRILRAAAAAIAEGRDAAFDVLGILSEQPLSEEQAGAMSGLAEQSLNELIFRIEAFESDLIEAPMQIDRLRVIGEMNEAMDGIDLRIGILTDLLENSPGAARDGRIASVLINIADRKDLASDVRASAARGLMHFVLAGSTAAAEWFIGQNETGAGEMAPSVRDALLPDNAAGAHATLRTPSMIGRRAGFLILERHRNSREFLLDVARDEDVDVRFRLFALILAARSEDGKPMAPGVFEELLDSLYDPSENLVRLSVSDNGGIISMLDGRVLHDQEAAVLTAAAALVMARRDALRDPEKWQRIFADMASMKIRASWNNANAGWLVGSRLFKASPAPAPFFMQVMVHELGHNILRVEHEFGTTGLSNGILHELFADLQTRAFSELFGLDFESYASQLRFDDHLAAVRQDLYHSTEVHEGARAQMRIVDRAIAETGAGVDTWALIDGTAAVLSDTRNRGLKAVDFVRTILELVAGAKPESERASSTMAMFMSNAFKAQLILGKDPFFVDEDDLRQPILAPTGVRRLLGWLDGPASILNPLIQRLPMGPVGFGLAALATVVGLPLIENALFFNGLLPAAIAAAAVLPMGGAMAAVVATAGVFAFAHVIVRWIVRAFEEGPAGFTTAALLADLRGFGVKAAVGAVLSLPFLLMDPTSATIIAGLGHAFLNLPFVMEESRRRFAAAALETGAPAARDLLSRRNPGFSAAGIVGAMHTGTGNPLLNNLVNRMNRIAARIGSRAGGESPWNILFDRLDEARAEDDAALALSAVQALVAAGVPADRAQAWADRIIPVNVAERRLAAGTDAVGGLIVRHRGKLRVLFPRHRLAAPDADTLGDLLHEIVEIELLENGRTGSDAHELAMKVREAFVTGGAAAAADLADDLRRPYRAARIELAMTARVFDALTALGHDPADLSALSDAQLRSVIAAFFTSLESDGWFETDGRKGRFGRLAAQLITVPQVENYRKTFGHFDGLDLVIILQRIHSLTENLDSYGVREEIFQEYPLGRFVSDLPLSEAQRFKMNEYLGLAGDHWLGLSPHPEVVRMFAEGRPQDLAAWIQSKAKAGDQAAIERGLKAFTEWLGIRPERLRRTYQDVHAKRMQGGQPVERMEKKASQALMRDILNDYNGSLKFLMFEAVPRVAALGFKIERYIGAGADGAVFVGRFEGRRAVAKVNFPKAADMSEAVQQTTETLAALAGVEHVVENIHLDTENDLLIEINEFVDGDTLKDTLDQRSAAGLPLRSVLDIVQDYLRLHAALHARGRTNRDVMNLTNVLVQPDGRQRLVDIGNVIPLSPEAAGPTAPHSLRNETRVLVLAAIKIITGQHIHTESMENDELLENSIDKNLFIELAGGRTETGRESELGLLYDAMIDAFENGRALADLIGDVAAIAGELPEPDAAVSARADGIVGAMSSPAGDTVALADLRAEVLAAVRTDVPQAIDVFFYGSALFLADDDGSISVAAANDLIRDFDVMIVVPERTPGMRGRLANANRLVRQLLAARGLEGSEDLDLIAGPDLSSAIAALASDVKRLYDHLLTLRGPRYTGFRNHLLVTGEGAATRVKKYIQLEFLIGDPERARQIRDRLLAGEDPFMLAVQASSAIPRLESAARTATVDQIRDRLVERVIPRGDRPAPLTTNAARFLGRVLGFSARATELYLAPVIESPLLLLAMVMPGGTRIFAALHPDTDPRRVAAGVRRTRIATLALAAALVLTAYGMGFSVPFDVASVGSWLAAGGLAAALTIPAHHAWNRSERPEAVAARMARLLRTGFEDRAGWAAFLSDITPAEPAFGRDLRISSPAAGRAVAAANAAAAEMRRLIEAGGPMSTETALRLADLLIASRFMSERGDARALDAGAAAASADELGRSVDIYGWLPADPAEALARAGAHVAGAAREGSAAERVILVLGADDPALRGELQRRYGGAIAAGRVVIAAANPDGGVVDLLRRTARAPGEAIDGSVARRFLVPEGVFLPAGFFDLHRSDLTPAEAAALQRSIEVFIILQSVPIAVGMTGSLITDWEAVRQIMIQA